MIKRYWLVDGQMITNAPHLDGLTIGGYVPYADARRDIERLGNELFAARAAYKELEAQRRRDLKIKDDCIALLEANARQACIALGFGDPDDAAQHDHR